MTTLQHPLIVGAWATRLHRSNISPSTKKVDKPIQHPSYLDVREHFQIV